jgi:hypothetical protein
MVPLLCAVVRTGLQADAPISSAGATGAVAVAASLFRKERRPAHGRRERLEDRPNALMYWPHG